MKRDKRIDELVQRQVEYVKANGGYACLWEADDTYNSLNFEILRAYKECHTGSKMGSVFDLGHHGIEDIPDDLRNFCCDFVVPETDDELEKLVYGIRTGHYSSNGVRLLQKAVEDLGGEWFIWY